MVEKNLPIHILLRSALVRIFKTIPISNAISRQLRNDSNTAVRIDG